ncbi:beta strand repeat-containing protein [Microbacterium sp. NPDC055665]
MITSTPRAGFRRLLSALAAVLLVAAGLVGVSMVTAPSALAAPNLICTGSTVYATNQGLADGDLWQIDGTTGAATLAADLPGDFVVNQLGISPGGGAVYFTKQGVLYNYTLATEAFVSTPALALPGYGTVGGAVNPANGLFYYGGVGPEGFRIAVYDPATNTNLGVAATVQLPTGITLGNSDFAFDTQGRMYIVGNVGTVGTAGNILRVNGQVPSTAADVVLTSSRLTSIAAVPGVTYAGIAFTGNGDLYVGGGTGMLRVNPTTGVVAAQLSITGPASTNMTDFATCDSPPTLTVEKDVVGRLQPGDQFALDITGGGIVPGPGSSGVTEGSEDGLQNQSSDEIAGAVIVQQGDTYDFAEAASGTTDLANYVSRWECTDSDGDELSAGDGSFGAVTIPAVAGIAVVCTIFNDPLIPGLTLDKRVTEVIDTNDNGYNDVGDQIQWEFELTNTGETELTGLTVNDDVLTAAGIGITCDPAALAPTASVVCTADAPYTITAADLSDGQVVNTATASGTPPGQPPVVTPPDTTNTPVGGYTVVKSADPASGAAVASGDVITYTLTVSQQGLAAVVGASLEDDLAAVLDDADYNDDLAATSGTFSFDEDAESLEWSGDLSVGGVVTITYSVTVTGAGDGELANVVTSPGCTTECSTDHLVGSYSVVKSSDPESGSSVQAGDVVTYTLTVAQSGLGSVRGATLDDDLAAVLDDATFNGDAAATSGTVGFDPATATVSWDGDLAVGATVTITYSVTITGAGDGTLTNVVESPGCTTACSTEHFIGSYTVVKSSDPADGSTVTMGDTIEYSIVVTQTGDGAVADASLSDDLAAVLDDADYNGDVSATAGDVAVDASVLTWSGALGVGDTVTITYSVTVDGAGDGTLTNAVTSPGCADECSTEHLYGDYAVVKSADPVSGSSVEAGDTVTYTLTVTQSGPGAVTAATLSDDLTAVLDDADYNDDVAATAGSAVVDDSTLDWSGDLGVGGVVTITYSVTVTDGGDGELANVVTSPGCAEAAECGTEHFVGAYTVVKSSDPESGSSVQADDVVTYTLTVTQSGPGSVTAATLDDDLAAVLDDATFNGDAAATSGTVGFDPATATVSWDGDLAVGATVTVTYSVTITGAGDGTLTNVVTSPGCDTECSTAHLVGGYTVVKSSDPAAGSTVAAGSTIEYTIVVTQSGAGSVADATLSDDLAAVLDDATYNDDETATAGDVAYDAGTLTWNGALDVGETITITYSVTVTGAGDGVLTNAVTSPGCADECSTEHLYGDYAVAKSADPVSGSSVEEGDTVTYTLTVTQSGPGAVTGATLSDDLTDVLDDADYNDDAAASIGTPVFDDAGETLAWTSDLAPGAVVTITYSVTVTGAGDLTLANVVTSPGCATDAECSTEHYVGAYVVVKTSEPASGSTVAEGQVVDYTITVTQTGPGAVTGATLSDDLGAVLDDAAYNGDVAADAGTATIDGSTLTWAADLAVGDVVSITYSVTVGDIGSGDGTLRNVVTSAGCATETDCATVDEVGSYEFSKTSDPTSGSTVATGDTVTYTVTVTQRGVGPITGATVDDDLSGVLDDATFNDDATATAGSVVRDGTELHWSGDLAEGAVVTITYSVTVTGAGDREIGNVVSTADPAGSCDPDAECATAHRVPPPTGLAITGGELALGGLVAAGLLLALGGGLALRRRREHLDVS